MRYVILLRNIYHYIRSGYKLDPEYYLDTNPDLKDVKSPLQHYIVHGRQEGRTCCERQLYDYHVRLGEIEYDKNKETVIIVSHESSGTGAPLVGLNLAKEWLERYNVISAVLRKSNIHDDFVKNSFLVLENCQDNSKLCEALLSNIQSKYKIKGIICNSVETLPMLIASHTLNIPSVSLVHEFKDYTRPVGKLVNTVLLADNVVVPANIIKESLLEEIESVMGANKIPNNINILPQGKLKYLPTSYGENLSPEKIRSKLGLKKGTKIVVGAGYVQPRKGVDVFIEIAKIVKDKYADEFAFIWIGGGYDPEFDLSYSVWLKKQLDEYQLYKNFFFLEHQQSIDPLLELADVFLLTSRLDPFPNVVIDALNKNKHVVCFNHSTGFADFFRENECDATVVDYLDVSSASDVIVRQFEMGARSDLNKRLVDDVLDFADYSYKLEALLGESHDLVREQISMCDEIKLSGMFDVDYFNPSQSLDDAIKSYVNYSRKGLHVSSPLPGFSNLEWISKNKSSVYCVPLYEQLKLNSNVTTHNCHIVDTNKENSFSENNIAVHLHLFYTELAGEFASYFENITSSFDLYITVCKDVDEDEMRKTFSITKVNNLVIKKVANKGRDIGPLFIDLKDELFNSNYDMIGHFHSKKSFDVDGDGVGDRWRKYLMGSLVGSPAHFDQIQSIMEDKNVGLIFSEDVHEVCAGKNQLFIDALSKDLGIQEGVTSVFPVGTMFWAKPCALLPLVHSDFSIYIQPEPLPYDGSYMHAIERLLPTVVKSAGMTFSTVYTENTRW
ncbi:rhamnan synthesis F family protein [Vibrio sp. 10N.261.46.E12]|uniref:rhamnan synthesis F family protein n=1 Tax=unclassified Vibrio TaxID=2614977 RepID=UPI00097837A0|nr:MULTISPECIES: rhamnan synthesis F family protein [unclassified Vibrio]OMO32562.1 hypothetical protein BH584_16255 [Vibrio sp. 10N.261.45.E1]PMJ26040.1 hypothetical protein BCU27_00770 [Vibrio sp. 10N.286.45.B6]PML89647.1 hypothetical protein BCT66_07250 [Vibrio sp. 10N.261.49.E11]PMM69685.1 hypothetical protein BCT48_09855 [Vibrio sp. 10N.261.46.F12]PMM90717.1 hypothetical protein BCT46_01060 [Vibrio sp. 10N.261.46.E8]